MRRFVIFVLPLSLLAPFVLAAEASTQSPSSTRKVNTAKASAVKVPPAFSALWFRPVVCRVRNCEDQKQHGAVWLLLHSSKRVRISQNAAFMGVAAMNPRLSPDKRAAAWLEGRHFWLSDRSAWFGGTRLVVLQSPQRTRAQALEIRGQKRLIEDWFFWQNGTQIALLSRGTHGPAINELHDAKTGKLLKTWPGPKSLQPNAPEWAKKLGE